MNIATVLTIVKTAAEVADFLGVPYAGDVVAAVNIAPLVIADAKDAISRIEGMFSHSDPVSSTTVTLEQKHYDALNAVHHQFTTYAKLGRNPIDAVADAT